MSTGIPNVFPYLITPWISECVPVCHFVISDFMYQLNISLSWSVSLSLPTSIFVFLSLSLYLSMSESYGLISVCLSLWLCVSLSVCESVSESLGLAVFLIGWVCLSLSFPWYFCFCECIQLCLSLCISLCLSVILGLCVSESVFGTGWPRCVTAALSGFTFCMIILVR